MEVNFKDEAIKQFHVDTRDFYVLTGTEPSEKAPDLTKLVKYKDRFFFTAQELKDLIHRYFIDSGGHRKWRLFTLEGMGGWDLKYLRVYRTEHGFVICNKERRALNREFLSKEVTKPEY